MPPLLQRFAELHRVDNVPWYWQPLFWIYAVAFALPIYLYARLLHATVRFAGNVEALALRPSIHCLWHSECWPYFALRCYRGDVWINHPFWYMKPTHLALRWLGVGGFVLGSTGTNGRAAAEELIGYLRSGVSTMITPDGPYGPLHVLHKGVLHLAAATGAPILPIHLEVRGCFRLGGWDRKVIPLPFARIVVHVAPPIHVKPEGIDEALLLLTRAMDQSS